MTATMNAELRRLEAEKEQVLRTDTIAYQARRRAEAKEPMPAGWLLRMSENSKRFDPRIYELRVALAHAGPVAETDENVYSVPSTIAGPAFDALVAQAIEATRAPGAAAIVAAPPAPTMASEQSVDAVVARILGIEVGALVPSPEASRAPPEDTEEADALVARILAA